MLSKAQGNSNFFIRENRIVGRKRYIEVPAIMRGTSLYRHFGQPITDPFARSTDPSDAAEQP